MCTASSRSAPLPGSAITGVLRCCLMGEHTAHTCLCNTSTIPPQCTYSVCKFSFVVLLVLGVVAAAASGGLLRAARCPACGRCDRWGVRIHRQEIRAVQVRDARLVSHPAFCRDCGPELVRPFNVHAPGSGRGRLGESHSLVLGGGVCLLLCAWRWCWSRHLRRAACAGAHPLRRRHAGARPHVLLDPAPLISCHASHIPLPQPACVHGAGPVHVVE